MVALLVHTPMRRDEHVRRYGGVLHLQTAAVGAEAHYRRWPETHRPETLAPAAEALGKIGDIRAVEPLVRALETEGRVRRRAALKALGKIGDIRAVEPLVMALKDSYTYKHGVEYERIEKALEEIDPSWMKSEGARAAVPLLVAALKNEHWEVGKWRAGPSLVKIGRAAVEPLIAALKDEDS